MGQLGRYVISDADAVSGTRRGVSCGIRCFARLLLHHYTTWGRVDARDVKIIRRTGRERVGSGLELARQLFAAVWMPDHVQRFHPMRPLPCTRDAIAAPTDASTLRPERGLTCSVPTDRRRRPGAGVEGAAGKGQRAKGKGQRAGVPLQKGPQALRPRSACRRRRAVDVDLDRRPRPSVAHISFSLLPLSPSI